MAYVAQLEEREPTGSGRDEVIANFTRTQNEIIGICERVFDMDVSAEIKMAAADSKSRSPMGASAPAMSP